MLTRCVLAAAMILACAGAEALAQITTSRWTPPMAEGGPFSAPVVEPGAVGDISVVRLATERDTDDLVFYDRASGYALLVANLGIYKPGQSAPTAPLLQIDALCVLQFAAGLELTAVKQDDDERDDLVGYQKATGDVYRYYRRGEGCQ